MEVGGVFFFLSLFSFLFLGEEVQAGVIVS